MERRNFMTSMLALAASGSGSTDAATGAQGTQTAPPEYYLWRQYILRNGTGPRRVADYLQNAAIPALNRLGHSPIGVFEVVAGVPGPTLFVLTPLPTLDSLGTIEARWRPTTSSCAPPPRSWRRLPPIRPTSASRLRSSRRFRISRAGGPGCDRLERAAPLRASHLREPIRASPPREGPDVLRDGRDRIFKRSA